MCTVGINKICSRLKKKEVCSATGNSLNNIKKIQVIEISSLSRYT